MASYNHIQDNKGNSKRLLITSVVYLDLNKLGNWLSADWALVCLKPELFSTITAHTLQREA